MRLNSLCISYPLCNLQWILILLSSLLRVSLSFIPKCFWVQDCCVKHPHFLWKWAGQLRMRSESQEPQPKRELGSRSHLQTQGMWLFSQGPYSQTGTGLNKWAEVVLDLADLFLDQRLHLERYQVLRTHRSSFSLLSCRMIVNGRSICQNTALIHSAWLGDGRILSFFKSSPKANASGWN